MASEGPVTDQATRTVRAVRRTTSKGLTTAVHRSKALSKAGLLERMFTLAFCGLVYPQIWEDPVVDMEALSRFVRELVPPSGSSRMYMHDIIVVI